MRLKDELIRAQQRRCKNVGDRTYEELFMLSHSRRRFNWVVKGVGGVRELFVTGNECWPLSRRCSTKLFEKLEFQNFSHTFSAERLARPRTDGRNCAMKLENKLKRVGDWQKVKSSSSLFKTNFRSLISSSRLVFHTPCIFARSLIINSSIVRNYCTKTSSEVLRLPQLVQQTWKA